MPVHISSAMDGSTNTSGWYRLPWLNAEVPMPPKDLGVALVTVIMFLPAVVFINYLVSLFFGGARPAKAKKD